MRANRLWKEIASDLGILSSSLLETQNPDDKDDLRRLHFPAVLASRKRQLHSMEMNPYELKKYFIHGSRLDVAKIEPELIPVERAKEYKDLFKAATFFWSVPLSRGYGRRMRFIVLDRHHEAIIGILGIMDPVFNLRARDAWIGWSLNQKYKKLRSIMDCFILGAVPPYNSILGGKLILSMGFSRELRKIFQTKYAGTISEISHRRNDGKLAMLTVMSAFGRSSIYNRVSLPWGQKCESIGFTSGFGVFQIGDELFIKIREAMELDEHPYSRAYKFGQGPSWKFRVLRYALERTNFAHLLNHQVKREIFALELGHNTRQFLLGKSSVFRGHTVTVDQIASYWKERWGVPRSLRDQSYTNIDAGNLYIERLSETLKMLAASQLQQSPALFENHSTESKRSK